MVAVVLCHSAGMAEDHGFGRLIGGALDFGRYGVDLFFVISGFIIAIVSLEGRELKPVVTPGGFLMLRFTRIVPLMWIAIATYALLRFAVQREFDALGTLNAALLLPGGMAPFHIWSLQQEFVFYLIFALAMLTGGRWRWLLAAWFAAVAVAPLFAASAAPSGTLAVLLNSRHLAFAGGLAVALLWLRRTQGRRFRSPVEPLLALSLAAALAMLVAMPVLGMGLLAVTMIFFVPMLLFAAHVECPPGIARTAGETLGNASYAIYLFHLPAVAIVIGVAARVAPSTPAWLAILACTVAATLGGVALNLWLERPLIAWTRRALGPREAPQSP